MAIWKRVLAGVLSVAGGAVVSPVSLAAPASASTGPSPARYTFQAPGAQGTLGQKVIALTFDDGPGPYTPEVLSVLEQYEVPATFFEVGRNTLAYPQFTQELAYAGYPVENHTWSHVDLATIPVSDFSYEIDQTQSRIKSLTGIVPTCVRPPYNDTNATVVSQIAQRGLTTMGYSVDPQDWSLPGTQTIVSRVVQAAFPGAVVDLHDGGGDRHETVDALPQIITALRARGYSFTSICDTNPPPPFEVAFQANDGGLWSAAGTGWANWTVGVAPDTSPSIMRLGARGFEMAFQASGGALWTVGTAGWTNWGVGMAPGTSPSVVALPDGGFEVAFQAYGGALWSVGTAGWTNWGVGMAPGTDPSVYAPGSGGYEIAFQASGGALWTVGSAGWTNWGVGLAPGTSPSTAPLASNGYEIAFQASGGALWTVGTAGWTNWGVGMAPGTSPSVVAIRFGGFEVAFQANGGDLWTVGTIGWTHWPLGMAAGTSPAEA